MPPTLSNQRRSGSAAVQAAPKAAADTGTVARTLQLLACFSEQSEWPLAALARRLGLPRSTVHRLLNLARVEGFVDSDGQGIYRPGLALYRMAGCLAVEMPLRQIAQPLLDQFTRTYAETSLLTVLDRVALKMFFAAKVDAPAQMRYVIAMNTLGTLAWGASGRAMLAFLGEDEIAVVVGRAEPIGSQELQYYGQSSTLYSVQLGVRAFVVGDQRPLGAGWRERVDFTTLNAEIKALESIEPRLDSLVDALSDYRPRRRS